MLLVEECIFDARRGQRLGRFGSRRVRSARSARPGAEMLFQEIVHQAELALPVGLGIMVRMGS